MGEIRNNVRRKVRDQEVLLRSMDILGQNSIYIENYKDALLSPVCLLYAKNIPSIRQKFLIRNSEIGVMTKCWLPNSKFPGSIH